MYNSGKEKTTANEIPYFHVECRYLNFNGQVFDKASMALGIGEFEGARQINQLTAYLLEFHHHRDEIREYFLRHGRKFILVMGQHQMQYRGHALYLHKGDYIQVPVNGRIMIDVSYFLEVNPNYIRPQINELVRSAPISFEIWYETSLNADAVKMKGLDSTEMNNKDLMICNQTVYSWSFDNKQWRMSWSCDVLTENAGTNVVQSWICGGRHQCHCLESVFIWQSYHPRRKKESHSCPWQSSHLPYVQGIFGWLFCMEKMRLDHPSAVQSPIFSFFWHWPRMLFLMVLRRLARPWPQKACLIS